MATPATLKKIDEKKMATQKKREQQEADQLLPLSSMTNAPSAHLLVSGNPNPAPRMMDIRPLGQKNNNSKQSRQRQPQPMGMGAMVGDGSDFDDFALDQQYPGYTSFSAGTNHGHQHQQPPQHHQPHQMNMLATFSQIQIGPMPMKPLSAWNAATNAMTTMMKGARGGGGGFVAQQQQRRTHHEGPMPPPKLRPQTVENIPASQDTVEYTIRSNNIVCFHGKGHFLSTLYPVNIYVDGHNYPSVEHYYQAVKIFSLIGPPPAQELRMILDPLKAKSRAREMMNAWGVPNQKVEQWKNTDGISVLMHGLRHKFNQNPELRDKLLNTGDALLCQAYDRDSMFAVGMNEQQFREWAKENEGKVLKFPAQLTPKTVKYLPMAGKGKNVLGVLCMEVRKLILEAENPVEIKENVQDEENEAITAMLEEASSDESDEENKEEDEEEAAEQEDDKKGLAEEDEEEEDAGYEKELSNQINAMMGIGPMAKAMSGSGDELSVDGQQPETSSSSGKVEKKNKGGKGGGGGSVGGKKRGGGGK